ncbi:DUF4910 domain-containing protein [Pseudomonas veronii]|uniref:DUF4910 domain-containing protein n=1 Tax=Pseudomonas veronii TaxID=76761 RepID=A0A7Y1F771_PSEVE|nr:DUF4910 domain-containing protein [Pseudomonas veronii]NMY07568.1 DUF4910 domain-containing protein [Pseudomonas veronii]
MTSNELNDSQVGQYCHDLATRLYPICRSLTGPGVRETLSILASEIQGLEIKEVPSGTTAFDWTVPDEWEIRGAYIADEHGNKIVDFQDHNLHVLGYSEPVDRVVILDELEKHLYSLPDQPDAIPYITSYYSRRWGFCLTHNQRQTLKPGSYRVVIDSTLKPGVLNYAEVMIPGESKEEVFLSTYVCHPSMANNELSGPVVTTALVRWLMSLPSRKYTYRVVFIPETIGSIVYLSKHHKHLQSTVIAGFNISCVGDDRCYSYLPSRNGRTLSDRAAVHALRSIDPNFKIYTWLDRGSDERQYCSPGVDLPIATIMRSKYGEYPEYHTSLDDFSVVTPSGLAGGFAAIRDAIEIVEANVTLRCTVLCEPQLGKRGLYPTISTKDTAAQVGAMMGMISYCDGEHSLLDIAEKIGQPFKKLQGILGPLMENGLLVKVDS